MTSEDYRRALQTAIREYEALGDERRRIDSRLSELAQTIGTLSRLCGITATVPWGLTDACRTVLRNAGGPLTPVEVRDRLLGIGVDLSRYSHDLAAVHTTLKRLNEAGELRFIASGARKRAYIWERPARAAAMGPEVARIVREMSGEPSGSRRKVR
jgi:hypothetical protein